VIVDAAQELSKVQKSLEAVMARWFIDA
jgi:hypothetical protein